MNTPNKQWDNFRAVILHDVPQDSVQFIEMRRAFYAGMAGMFYIMQDAAEAKYQKLADMQLDIALDQIKMFSHRVKRGEA